MNINDLHKQGWAISEIDEEFSAVKALLAPGRRRRPEARARIRTLLAMEALRAEEVRVSKGDVDRVQRGILDGGDRDAVFPRLGAVQSEIEGDGVEVRVRFVKREGAPVRRTLRIDEYPSCRHIFSFGSQQYQRFSDNAFVRMRDALLDLDLEEVWREFGPHRNSA